LRFYFLCVTLQQIIIIMNTEVHTTTASHTDSPISLSCRQNDEMLYDYDLAMKRIHEEEHYIELCGKKTFEEEMEEKMNRGESISVEQLFHLIVNDVHKIYHEDGVQV